MGQKVNPVGMRIGLNKNWNSRWFASKKDYSTFLLEDVKLRNYLEKNLPAACNLSHIEIERKKKDDGQFIRIFIHVGRAGVILGREPKEAINDLTKKLLKIVSKNSEIKVQLIDVKQPMLDATIVANKICRDLEQRVSFRVAQKRAIQEVRKAGAKGIKTSVSGRLGGAEIARTEGYSDGTMAINTLKSDIDYACREALTTYGKLGVKVWICRGEIEIKPREKRVDKETKGE